MNIYSSNRCIFFVEKLSPVVVCKVVLCVGVAGFDSNGSVERFAAAAAVTKFEISTGA